LIVTENGTIKREKGTDIRWFLFIPLKIMKFNHFLQNQKEQASGTLKYNGSTTEVPRSTLEVYPKYHGVRLKYQEVRVK